MSLDTNALAAAVPYGVSMEAKRDALAALVAEVLGAHDAAFLTAGRVATRIRQATLDGRDRKDRLAVMGEPVRYAEVLWITPEGVASSLLPGSGLSFAHRFRVNVWWQYADHDTYASSSEAAFSAAMESRGGAGGVTLPGLLHVLRTSPNLPTTGGRATLTPPADEAPDLVPLDLQGKELAHFCTLTVTLT